MHNELKITNRDIWVPPIEKRYTSNELIMFKARDETSKTMSKQTCCRGKDHWILMFQTCFFLNWFHLNELKWFDNFHLFMCCSTYWNKILVDFLWSLMNLCPHSAVCFFWIFELSVENCNAVSPLKVVITQPVVQAVLEKIHTNCIKQTEYCSAKYFRRTFWRKYSVTLVFKRN